MLWGHYKGLLNAAIICGIIYYIAARIQLKHKPKWPNVLYGYRTPRSLKTKESFDAGNEYSSRLMLKISICLFLLGLIIAIFHHENYWLLLLIISLLAVTGATIFMIFSTEKYLKENFPD